MQVLSVGEWIVPFQAFQDHAGEDIYQHVVVLNAVLMRFQGLWFVLHFLNHAEKLLELCSLVGPRRPRGSRDVLDQLSCQCRGRRSIVDSAIAEALSAWLAIATVRCRCHTHDWMESRFGGATMESGRCWCECVGTLDRVSRVKWWVGDRSKGRPNATSRELRLSTPSAYVSMLINLIGD